MNPAEEVVATAEAIVARAAIPRSPWELFERLTLAYLAGWRAFWRHLDAP